MYVVLSTGITNMSMTTLEPLLEEFNPRSVSTSEAVFTRLLGLLIEAGLIYGLLRHFSFQNRAYQTIFAIIGINVIFAAIVALLLALVGPSIPILFVVLVIAIAVWSLFVSGFVFAIALDVTMFKGVLFAIGVGFASAVISLFLFGGFGM